MAVMTQTNDLTSLAIGHGAHQVIGGSNAGWYITEIRIGIIEAYEVAAVAGGSGLVPSDYIVGAIQHGVEGFTPSNIIDNPDDANYFWRDFIAGPIIRTTYPTAGGYSESAANGLELVLRMQYFLTVNTTIYFSDASDQGTSVDGWKTQGEARVTYAQ